MAARMKTCGAAIRANRNIGIRNNGRLKLVIHDEISARSALRPNFVNQYILERHLKFMRNICERFTGVRCCAQECGFRAISAGHFVNEERFKLGTSVLLGDLKLFFRLCPDRKNNADPRIARIVWIGIGGDAHTFCAGIIYNFQNLVAASRAFAINRFKVCNVNSCMFTLLNEFGNRSV